MILVIRAKKGMTIGDDRIGKGNFPISVLSISIPSF